LQLAVAGSGTDNPRMKNYLALAASALIVACGAAPARMPPKSGLDLSGFDRGVRPQADLYRFVGGTWLAKTPIPADLSDYGTFAMLEEVTQNQLHQLLEQDVAVPQPAGSLQRKLADFYRSFMDTDQVAARGLAPLAAELTRIDAIASPADVVQYMGYDQAIGVGEPIGWSVDQDPGNTDVYITAIEQSGLTMPDRDYYLRDEATYRGYRAKLTEYVGQLLALAGATPENAAAAASRIVALETRMARAHWTRVENRDPVKTYNRMSLEAAARLAPGFDWNAFLAAAGAPAQQLLILQPSYVTALAQMVHDVPAADWRSYFRFKLLDAYATVLPPQFDDAHFAFHSRVLSGVQEQRPRWKRAIALLDGTIGEIMGQRYVEHYFSADAKRRVLQLVNNLLRAYDQSIDGLDWMGPDTRARAREKLHAITVKMAYPDKWRDYSALSVTADDLLGNVERAAQFDHQRMVKRLGAPVDRTEWLMTPQTVNAYYEVNRNEIVFPAAILQPPFYDPTADNAVNYGGIGAVIGHEISHAFDDHGRQFDARGNLHNWWTDEDAARFKARTSALVAQYAADTVLDGERVNGELTLGENIADLSGVSIAYKAYHLSLGGEEPPVMDGFTGGQRFFLGWAQVWRRKYRDDNLRMRLAADPHSPSEFRANGPPSNIDAFYDAFGVVAGEPLYRRPEDRVRIW
jgi:predicted metalloendopeptidase